MGNFVKNNKKIAVVVFLAVIFFVVAVFIFFRGENVPVHLSAETVSSSEIYLSWSGDNNVSQYNIYRAEDSSDHYTRVGFTAEKEYLDDELEPATLYHYKVTQIADFEESDYSARATARTNPGVPTGLRATTVSFQEDLLLRNYLIWDYSVGAEKYYIYRSEEEDGIYQKIGSTVNESYSDTDLLPETTYYYRVTQVTDGKEGIHSDSAGTTTDTFWSCGEVLEYGGKNYTTAAVGGQCWITENLSITQDEIDRDCEIERYCYNNDGGMCGTYGGLYNFSSISCGLVAEGMQGICPLGWRIPTDDDWITLETEVGMPEGETRNYGFRGSNEGSKLAGRYDLWRDGSLRHSNLFGSSGFNALPGGYQPGFNIRLFYNLSESAIFWSSTQGNKDEECTFWEPAYMIREIVFDELKIRRDCHSRVGTAYVRCVRDH